MNLEKLRTKVGSAGDLKEFKRRVAALSKLRNPIPEYGVVLIDPRSQRTLDAKAPPPRGRTPLKAYQVYFFRTDRMASMPPWHQAKVADDFPESDDI